MARQGAESCFRSPSRLQRQCTCTGHASGSAYLVKGGRAKSALQPLWHHNDVPASRVRDRLAAQGTQRREGEAEAATKNGERNALRYQTDVQEATPRFLLLWIQQRRSGAMVFDCKWAAVHGVTTSRRALSHSAWSPATRRLCPCSGARRIQMETACYHTLSTHCTAARTACTPRTETRFGHSSYTGCRACGRGRPKASQPTSAEPAGKSCETLPSAPRGRAMQHQGHVSHMCAGGCCTGLTNARMLPNKAIFPISKCSSKRRTEPSRSHPSQELVAVTTMSCSVADQALSTC